MSSMVVVAGQAGASSKCINLRQHFSVLYSPSSSSRVSTSSSSSSSSSSSHQLRIRCATSEPKRGFGPDSKADKIVSKSEGNGVVLPERKENSRQPGSSPSSSIRAPGLSSQTDGKSKSIPPSDFQFEERLQSVKRSALDLKKTVEKKERGAIDYDEPVTSERSTIGLGTKIGVGVAVVVFGFVFALGDFLPSGSPTVESTAVNNELSPEAKANLEASLQKFQDALKVSPADPIALEGAAVNLAELGEYKGAASLLEELTKEKPNDPEVFRLLAETKYEAKDYEGSAAAFKTSATLSKTINFEVLRGLTNALLNAKKPNEAVQVLEEYRERLKSEKRSDDVTAGTELVDPIQVELLLGKAYSDWGHVGDAVSVYDQLISSHPEDFRGYLAKGIILKENGKVGDAERMFIQARFFAPEKARPLVDRYSKR